MILYQINLTEAVYLCENKLCSYPEGHKCILVKRSLDEVPIYPKKPRNRIADSSGDIDQFLVDFCNDIGYDNEETDNNDTLQHITRNDDNIDSFLQDIHKVTGRPDNEVQKITEELSETIVETQKETVTDIIDEDSSIQSFFRNDTTTRDRSVELETLLNENEDETATGINYSEVSVQSILCDIAKTKDSTLVEPEKSPDQAITSNNIKTYKNKRCEANNDKVYCQIATGTLINDIINCTHDDNIDYVRKRSDSSICEKYTANRDDLDVKDIYKSVFEVMMRKDNAGVSKDQVEKILEHIDTEETVAETVFQNESLNVKVYDSFSELPVEYQEKIYVDSNEGNFLFTVVTEDKLNETLNASIESIGNQSVSTRKAKLRNTNFEKKLKKCGGKKLVFKTIDYHVEKKDQ